ncbi:hypothetical protein B0J13DRAFT_603063 [Dactylonectria estremocensis]|uniref:C2H2-type domain-containing protein n=1 Tax=Dactylonectria estremocensis TaxID=1079267 RepID=A0A9P9FAR5_9HYPO|nr:hypothetical protein B0J13DRAFT_603063 [Dactylonectria estremocensis]
MGLSRRSARAPQSESGSMRMQQSELSPVEAQCGEKFSRSIGGRLRDNGRRYMNLFRPFRLSAPSQAYSKAYPTPGNSQSFAPIGLPSRSVTSRRFTMADLPAKFPMSQESNQPQTMDSITSDQSRTELPDADVTTVMRHSAFVGRASQRESINANAELQSSTNSLFSLDLEGSIKKPRLWLGRMKGYTIRGFDRLSLPVSGTTGSSGGVSDLIGVGSQYESANKSATPGSQAYREELDRHGPSFSTASRVLGSEHDSAAVPRSLWNTTFKRNSSTTISRRGHAVLPEIPSEIDDLTRRLSNDTAPTSVSVVESVFSRPSSIVSTATSWDSNGRVGTHIRGRSLFRKNASSSSIFSTRASPGPHPAIDMDDPTPPMALPVTAWPPRSIDSWVACLDHSVSDQITAAGRVAQQRRVNKSRLSEVSQEDLVDEITNSNPSTMMQSEDHNGDGPESTLEPALSTIEEGCSDAGCSTSEPISMQYHTLGDIPQTALLSIPPSRSIRGTSSCSGTDTAAESTSVGSRERGLTPATSVSEDLDLDDVEGDEMSEDDESISNLTDETNESFHEAFIATSLDSALLIPAITLKDHIASLVLTRVMNWVRSCSPGESSRTNLPDSSAGASFGTGRSDGSASRDVAGKKRGFDDRNPAGFGRGNGDDQDKRRKTGASIVMEEPLKVVSNLACPFPKGHPGRKWPRCQRPFASVHRIKEHIYRTHELPIRCARCFEKFTEAKELEQHAREATRCPLLAPPDEMLGVDEGTSRKLRARTGARNGTQEEKWKHMFKIIFPHVQDEDMPSPYYDLKALENPMSPETRAQYRRFLRKEIPSRVTRKVTEGLSEMPEVRDNLHFSERRISEVIHRAVWDAIDDVLPSLLPQSAPPYDCGTQLASTTEAQQSPINTSPLQSTYPPDTPATIGKGQGSPDVEDITTTQEPSHLNHTTISHSQTARSQSQVSQFNFDEDLLGSHSHLQSTVEESDHPNDDSLLVTGQTGWDTSALLLQPDFDNYAEFSFNLPGFQPFQGIEEDDYMPLHH